MVFSKVAMLALILTCATGAWAQDEAKTAVSVFESPDPEITRVAASVLMLFKHKPAVCAGTCAMQFAFEVNLRKVL